MPRPDAPTAGGRTLAPDLARGGMLILIALANVPWFLWGRQHGPGSVHPTDGGTVDTVVQAITIVGIDMRIYPMFAFLFGYGIVQFARSREARGFSDRQVRRLLRQRHWMMLAIGVVHATLLWFGDVVGAYGIVGLLLVWVFFRRRTRTLKIWIGILLGAAVVGVVFSLIGGWFVATTGTGGTAPAAGMSSAIEANAMTNYPASALTRLVTWAGLTALSPTTIVLPVLIAWVWARRGILEEPGRHLPLLRRVAVGGIGVGLVGGVAPLLSHLQVLPNSDQYWWAFSALQSVTGMLCGIGYVSAFALAAHHIGQRAAGPGPVTAVLTAVGQNSLTCYLGQSLVFGPLLAAWGLGIGGGLGSAGAAAVGLGAWALWAVVATLLTQRGKRGPAEWLLRRITKAGVSGPRADPAPVG